MPEQTTPPSTDTTVGSDATEQESSNPIVGKWGFGYFSTSAPFGMRRWVSDKTGYDLGVGFDVSSGTKATWATAVEGGLLRALARLENIIVFIRGGAGATVSDQGAGVGLAVNLDAMLGGEFFLTGLGFPNLSFTAGIGAKMLFEKAKGQDLKVTFTTASAPANLVESAALGFHIYF